MTDWTILIATLGRRQARFLRLLGQLAPQMEEAAGRADVLALWNNGERPLARVRQDLAEHAQGTYISFTDDDDEVPPYYVPRVLPLLDGVDYIGWRMQCWLDGAPLKPTFHSLRYSHWSEDRDGYYRDVSHLNPVLRSKALAYADFTRQARGDPAEDVSWSAQMRGHLHTEHFIEDVMYYYRSSSEDSTWRGIAPETGRYQRPEFTAPWFAYHPASSP